MQTARDSVIKPVNLLQFSTKYPIILCNIRLCGIAVNRWRMAIQGRVTGREVTVETVLRNNPCLLSASVETMETGLRLDIYVL